MQRSSVSVTEIQAKKMIKDALEAQFSTAGAIIVNVNPGTEKNPSPHVYVTLQRRDVTNYENMVQFLEEKNLQFQRDFLNTNLGSPVVQGIFIHSPLETVLEKLTAGKKINTAFLSKQAMFQQGSSNDNAKSTLQKPVKKENSKKFNEVNQKIQANLKLSFGPQTTLPEKIQVEQINFEPIDLPIKTHEMALKAYEQVKNGNRDLMVSIINDIMLGHMNPYHYLVASVDPVPTGIEKMEHFLRVAVALDKDKSTEFMKSAQEFLKDEQKATAEQCGVITTSPRPM